MLNLDLRNSRKWAIMSKSKHSIKKRNKKHIQTDAWIQLIRSKLKVKTISHVSIDYLLKHTSKSIQSGAPMYHKMVIMHNSIIPGTCLFATRNLLRSGKMATVQTKGHSDFLSQQSLSKDHRLSIDRRTKRGKEKSPSDGYCQCQKEMDDQKVVNKILASQF
jgi:hypothetical protein